jgi:two-component system response regulator QseB
MRILLAEDDPVLGDGLNTILGRAGYAVDWVRDGLSAEAALAAASYDLLVLDLSLPRRSGVEVLADLRAKQNELPVLVITARDQVADRVRTLDLGADDYLVKPFDIDELCARLRALRRRSAGRSAPVIRHGDLMLDPASHHVARGGTPVDLSPREFALLQVLLECGGRVLSRERLQEAVYGWEDAIGSNAVEVHIHHLRRKLGTELIRTVRGVGYVID